MMSKASVPISALMKWPSEAAFAFRKFCFDLTLYHEVDRVIAAAKYNDSTPILIKRRLTGYGQERGSIGIELLNSLNEPVDLLWMEEWPWWLKVYLHTLRGHVNGEPAGKPISYCHGFATAND